LISCDIKKCAKSPLYLEHSAGYNDLCSAKSDSWKTILSGKRSLDSDLEYSRINDAFKSSTNSPDDYGSAVI
jgi:hypothetical protein